LTPDIQSPPTAQVKLIITRRPICSSSFLHQRVLVRLILQQAKSFLSKLGRWRSYFLRRWYGDWWCRCSTSFWYLLSVHSPWPLAGGYLLAAVLMIGAAIVETFFSVDAEGRSLEDIADPLSAG
jgi:hypothetical protein